MKKNNITQFINQLVYVFSSHLNKPILLEKCIVSKMIPSGYIQIRECGGVYYLLASKEQEEIIRQSQYFNIKNIMDNPNMESKSLTDFLVKA